MYHEPDSVPNTTCIPSFVSQSNSFTDLQFTWWSGNPNPGLSYCLLVHLLGYLLCLHWIPSVSPRGIQAVSNPESETDTAV